MGQNSVLGVVICCGLAGLGGQTVMGTRHFVFSVSVQTSPELHPALLPVGTGAFSWGVRQPWSDNPPSLSSSEVKNE